MDKTRARRTVTVLSIAAGLAVSCALVWSTTSAAFSGYSTNPGNTFATGTISLGDDDSNGALFSVSGLAPGDTGSRCVRVTYTGDARSDVRFYTTAATYSGSLGPYLDLVVSEGSAGTYANSTCSDWTTGTQIYSGTLSGFASAKTDYSSGVYNSADRWSPVANGQYRVYKFDYTLQLSAPNSTQSTSAGIGFTWEARSNSAPNLALNRTATGSSACNASQDWTKAVNGTFNGGVNDKFCTGAVTKYLQVDLGSSQTIAGFAIRHAGAGGELASYDTRDYDIAVSPDGSAWTTVVQARGNTANVSSHTVATTGRYVKLTSVYAEQSADSAMRIYEFEVYGS
ncbi:MAG: hypothetical protein JWO79_537 [Actinomycetia bacterium]|nr:hypothetical protein [Actinomycetes bacterium]